MAVRMPQPSPDPLPGHRSRATFFALIALVLVAVFLLDLALGSVMIPPEQILSVLLGGEAERPSWTTIILLFRLPKAITAMFAGAGLAMSGLLMQTLFRNPLADPSVLGVSAGAGLGVALIVLTAAGGGMGASFIEGLGLYGKIGMVTAAGLGAAAVLALILVAARWTANIMMLLLIGVFCGFAVNAAVTVLIHFSVAELIQAYVSWTFGSFAATNQNDLALFLPIMTVGLMGCLPLSKPLNGLLIGELYAQSMGVRIGQVRVLVIVLTALLTGTVTAFCGPVAFIGLAVPHLARMIMGSSDHRGLLPAVILIGALVALIADLLAQFPGSEAMLPLNAVTALLGSPMVVWLLVRRRNIRQGFVGE